MAEDKPTTSKSRLDSNMTGHPVFGDPLEKLPQFRLPTFLQLLNRARFLKKTQHLNREDSLRPTVYNVVASELETVWMEAFVVPVIDYKSLAGKLQREIEAKLKYVSKNRAKIVNHPEKLTAEVSEMKKLYSITKCTCFLKATHR